MPEPPPVTRAVRPSKRVESEVMACSSRVVASMSWRPGSGRHDWDSAAERRVPEHRAPADDPPLGRGVVGRCPVHQAAVVPHHELPGAPAVPVDRSEAGGRLVQLVHERAARLVVHTLDRFRVIAEEQAVAVRLGVGTDDRVGDRRHLPALLVGHRLLAVPARAGEIEVVDGAQVLDPLARPVREAVEGAVHVAEPGLTSLGRDLHRVHHRREPGPGLPRPVRVPRERSPVRVPPGGVAVRIEVGEPVELGEAVRVVLVHDMDLDLAETAGELDLPARRASRLPEKTSTCHSRKARCTASNRSPESGAPKSNPVISAPSPPGRGRRSKFDPRGCRAPLTGPGPCRSSW